MKWYEAKSPTGKGQSRSWFSAHLCIFFFFLFLMAGAFGADRARGHDGLI